MTTLQNAMLIKIARHEMTCINGGEPSTTQETETWADMIIESAEDKGVFTSLLTAGMVAHHGAKRDAIVKLTAAGLAAYKAL